MFLTLLTPLLGLTCSDSAATEYATLFRDPNLGTAKFHVLHTEAMVASRKATLLNVGDKKAWLLEDPSTGNLVFIIGDETLTAPKTQDKEPITSISYFSKVYANAAAPKPKKKGILGGLGGNLLGAIASGLTGNLLSSALTGSLGSMSGQVLANTTASTLQGFAVREMTQSLGRATSTTSMTSGDDPMVVREITRVDKTTMVETLYLRKTSLQESEVPNPTAPKTVTATELYERFSKFLTSGIDEKEEKTDGDNR